MLSHPRLGCSPIGMHRHIVTTCMISGLFLHVVLLKFLSRIGTSSGRMIPAFRKSVSSSRACEERRESLAEPRRWWRRGVLGADGGGATYVEAANISQYISDRYAAKLTQRTGSIASLQRICVCALEKVSRVLDRSIRQIHANTEAPLASAAVYLLVSTFV